LVGPLSPLRIGRRAALLTTLTSAASSALGRTPYGGRLRLSVPWPIKSLDPAQLSDGFSALFAAAVFEPLFGLDGSSSPYPALAEALPTKLDTGSRVTLRPGLRTAAGRPLSGGDLVATLARARTRGAIGLLGDLDAPSVDPKDPLGVIFPRATPESLARVLSSELLALVPKTFSPLAPDGCGAFKVELLPGRASFSRNPLAARGAAYLDAIDVSSVSDLAELLRGFESGATDVGWFGTGLYRAAKDAVRFEASRYGFAVLLPGAQARAWGAPGTLQALLDAVPEQQLAHLGLRGLPAVTSGSPAWGGPATSIVVSSSAPQLLAVARAVASSLSSPGHELTVDEKAPEELAALRSSRQFGLMVDSVRAPNASPREVELLLRTAASPDGAKRAPKTASASPRELGRQLPLGVIGELSVWGTRRAPFVNLETWQLGAVSFRASGA
jgi:peptide/nickel transport system substrate-binding protein